MERVLRPLGRGNVRCGMMEEGAVGGSCAANRQQKQHQQQLVVAHLVGGGTPTTKQQKPQPVPTTTSHRRRTRSTGSLPWLNKQSGDSSSSMAEWEISRDMGMSSLYQSDSDDVSGAAQAKQGLYNLRQPPPPRLLPNIESDSVNENFSPVRPITRRKRKLKRMAMMEVELGGGGGSSAMGGTSSSRVLPSTLVVTKKKRILRHCENRYCGWATSGKRKRSSVRVGGASPPTSVLALHRLTIRDHQPALPPSSSSLSSSESDTGIYTNDEGREGDDEQSDWVGEASGGGGLEGGDDEDVERGMGSGSIPNPLFPLGPASSHATSRRHYHHHHHHHYHHQHHHHLLHPHVDKTGREIRGGRRRVRSDRAGFSILTSANEQLSRFLRDPAKSELRLHPMREHERHQLGHLADLYSLDMHLTDHHMGLTCPVLTKTSNTMRAEPVSSSRLHITGHSKRRRRTPPKTNSSNPSNSQQESLDSSLDNEKVLGDDEEDMSTEECAAGGVGLLGDHEVEDDDDDTGDSLHHYSS